MFSISELGSFLFFLGFLADRGFFFLKKKKDCRTTRDDFAVQVVGTWRWGSSFEL